MEDRLVFVVWCRHSRRAATLNSELHGTITFQYEDKLKAIWIKPFGYLLYAWRTWLLLERERPNAVIVQMPPIFAPLVVALWCKLRGRKLTGHAVRYVIDSHTGTFYDPKWTWSLPLFRLLAQHALVTLVASEDAVAILKRWRINHLFLIDGLPLLNAPTGSAGSEGASRVAVISGFGPDEPIFEVFAAARMLPQVMFYFSGDTTRLGHQQASILAQQPENVVFTGFLSDSDYVGLLKNVHGLLDLTKAPSILTCGAYEALAVGKPSVVSDWLQMKRYFTRGFIYVDNTPEAIAQGVQKMLDEQALLLPEISAMRTELLQKRQPVFDELLTLLHRPPSRDV